MALSLYETLLGNFLGGLNLHAINEEEQIILSVLDNMQRIVNSRAGALSHLPDYGLPDMSKILQGMPGTAHLLLATLSSTLLKYEPRLKSLKVILIPPTPTGVLEYAIDAELETFGTVRFGTAFMPEGRIIMRHLRKQNKIID